MSEIFEPIFSASKKTNTLIDFTLHLADSSLIMGHRLSEWTGHGPSLEQDIAMTNISLDLIGQSRNFYQYAAALMKETDGKTATEDTLAFLRDAHQYKNFLLVELPNGDWGQTILKIFFFTSWLFEFYQKLTYSADKQLAAIAEKSLKEVTYHVRWSSEWVIRLGDGTTESNQRMQKALEYIWSYTGEFFQKAPFEEDLLTMDFIPDIPSLEPNWQEKTEKVMQEATLALPLQKNPMLTGGKNGVHTEHLGYILAEMQFLQRAYPGCDW